MTQGLVGCAVFVFCRLCALCVRLPRGDHDYLVVTLLDGGFERVRQLLRCILTEAFRTTITGRWITI